MRSANSLLIELGKRRIAQRYHDRGRFINKKIYQQLKAKQKCDLCGKSPIIPEIHHVVPVTKGGTNTADNLLALCHECHANADKKTK
jgi:5-methylcytosine-specific restriction protein A